MTTLTRAELAKFPEADPIESWARHEAGIRPGRGRSLRRAVDLRPFPGATREERAMAYLRAHFVAAQRWNDDDLRATARRLLQDSDVIV